MGGMKEIQSDVKLYLQYQEDLLEFNQLKDFINDLKTEVSKDNLFIVDANNEIHLKGKFYEYCDYNSKILRKQIKNKYLYYLTDDINKISIKAISYFDELNVMEAFKNSIYELDTNLINSAIRNINRLIAKMDNLDLIKSYAENKNI